MRADLERLLAAAWPELAVAASVGDGTAALEALDRLQPDIVFLDIRMPPPSGLEVARRVGAETAIVFAALESLVRRLADAPAYLHWLRVGCGERVELVAVDEVCFFRADHKYTAAVTRDAEHLVRTSITDLATRLDPERFWRIHRGVIVNVAAIEAACRDLRGRYRLTLKDRPEVLRVSATHGHLFRRM